MDGTGVSFIPITVVSSRPSIRRIRCFAFNSGKGGSPAWSVCCYLYSFMVIPSFAFWETLLELGRHSLLSKSESRGEIPFNRGMM